MKLEWRRRIARIKPVHHLARILMYNSGCFFYRKIYREQDYDALFSNLKDSKSGKRCFIIGNGPSLRSQDLDRLQNEDCFAANAIYHIFPQTLWRPKFYMIMDRYFNASPDVIAHLECDTVFLGDYYWRFNQVTRKDAICLHQHIPLHQERFDISQDISKRVTSAHTVSFVAMQIAAYLGYKEIYLIGVDHNYGFEIDTNGKVIKTDKSVSHFYANDHPEEHIANVIGMTKAYISFRNYAEEHGIIVKNATRGGKLEVFERVDFDELMQSKKQGEEPI